MRLGLKLGLSYTGGVSFTPLNLFGESDSGAYFNVKTAALYQTSAGEILAAADGDTVGQVIDQRVGIGGNALTNGDFSDDLTGWTTHESPTTATATGGLVTITGEAFDGIKQNFSTVPGVLYLVEFDRVGGGVSSQVNVYGQSNLGGVAIASTSATSGSDTVRKQFTAAGSNASAVFWLRATGAGYASRVAVMPAAGINFSQATSGDRPTLRISGGMYYLEGGELDCSIPANADNDWTLAIRTVDGWTYQEGLSLTGATTVAIETAREVLIIDRALTASEKSRLGETVIYADSQAAGAATGVSWADAYTDLEAAFEAAPSGAKVLTNSTEAAPFPVFTATIEPNITWVSNGGDDAETWISGATLATWSDDGGGVFSTTPAGDPIFVAYDFKRDDTSGTVTGVDLTQTDFAAAIAATDWSDSDLVAWYGFLEEEAAPTSTPLEGFWSYTGGTLYINPPGSPVLATVNDKAIYSSGAPGAANFNTTGSVNSSFRHYGRLVTHFTPGETDGTGYGVRHRYSEGVSIEDVISIASGYHAVGLAGQSTINNSIKRCASVGGTGVGNPYVFYSSVSYDIDDANLLGEDLIYVSAPYLKTDGSPLRSAYVGHGQLGYSHTSGTYDLGGLTWRRCVGLDPSWQIFAKHSITPASAPAGEMIGARDVPMTFVQGAPSSFPVHAIDCVGLGPAFGPEVFVYHSGCTFDSLGYEQGGFTFLTAPRVWHVAMDGCTWTVTPPTNYEFWFSVEDGYGTIGLYDTVVNIERIDGFKWGIIQFTEPEGAALVTVSGTTINHNVSGGSFITIANTMSGADITTAGSVVSSGNTFGVNVTAPVIQESGATVMTPAEFFAAFGN